MARPHSRILAGALGLFVATTHGQDLPAPDPAAARAFEELVTSMRGRPALRVRTVLTRELGQGEAQATGEEVEAEFTYGGGAAGVVGLRGFTCHVDGETLWAVHESTDDAYYSEPYEDSPYWAFLLNFQDIPFPHLAIFWGEPGMDDLYMQLYPDTPMIVPTAVEEIVENGATLRRITLSGPDAQMTIDADPESLLIERITHVVNGGRLVEPGATLTTRYRFDYETFDHALGDDELRFDPGDRERVDVLAALLAAPSGPAGAGPHLGGGGGLAGAEAPGFALATADGGVIDLQTLRGRVVVLDFWATWCGPCRAALPLLHDVERWAKEMALPVDIVTVNVWERGHTADDRLAAARKYWTDSGFTLPIAMDYKDEVAAAYGLTAIPATVVIGPDGVVHAQHSGLGGDYVETLKRDITEALDRP